MDLEQPSVEEIRQISEEFSLNERIERELLSPSPSSFVAGDGDTMLLVLHFPTQGEGEGETKNQEVDFVVSRHFVLTVRYEIVAPLHHLKKLLETRQLVSGKTSLATDVLLEVLFAHLYTAMRDHTNHIADALSAVEKEMFDGKERTTVRSISNISRSFLHLESVLANQEEPLEHFLNALSQRNVFGPTFPDRALRILSERSSVARIVQTHRAVATEMRETNLAILGARQNEIIKTLTVVNFIFLPLGLISWIFAMRTEGMPLIASHDSFWKVVGAMATLGIILTFFAARKKWI